MNSSPPSRTPGAPRSASEQSPIKGLQTTATLWYLGFDSELVYVGDSGSTEAGPASRRTGVEITNYIYPNRWTAIDLDMSFSKARYIDVPAGEDFILARSTASSRPASPSTRQRASAPERSAASGCATSGRAR